jgi:hypothetical protein
MKSVLLEKNRPFIGGCWVWCSLATSYPPHAGIYFEFNRDRVFQSFEKRFQNFGFDFTIKAWRRFSTVKNLFVFNKVTQNVFCFLEKRPLRDCGLWSLIPLSWLSPPPFNKEYILIYLKYSWISIYTVIPKITIFEINIKCCQNIFIASISKLLATKFSMFWQRLQGPVS